MLCAETSQKQRQDALRILTERVTSAGNAPVVHQAAFKHGVGLRDVVDGKLFLKKAKLFTFADNLTQKFIIGTVWAHHVFFAAGDKLRSEKLAQQVNGYRVVDHQEQFLIHKDQFFNRSERGVHRFGKFIVFFIKKIGKRREKRVFSIKIVIKGASGSTGGLYYFLHGGVIIALLIEQLPCGGNNFTFRVACIFFLHNGSFLRKSPKNFKKI